MTEAEVEALAERVYAAYAALPEADGRQVEPELVARRLLGLKVDYRRLSRDGGILGITAPAAVAVPVLEEGGRTWYLLDGRTILLDAGLLSPWVSPGRRRFTLMHEVAHRLLGGTLPRGGESLADKLASALLMPLPLLLKDLCLCGWQAGPLPDRELDPERWRAFRTLAEIMGVSRQALAIRLERLGLTAQRRGWTLRPAPALTPAQGELEE